MGSVRAGLPGLAAFLFVSRWQHAALREGFYAELGALDSPLGDRARELWRD